MLIARFSVHDPEPWISPKAADLGTRMWLVRVHASNGATSSTDKIRNQNPCNLVDILDTAKACIDEMLEELDKTITDAGFQVFLLR